MKNSPQKTLDDFLTGKSATTLDLFDHFVSTYTAIGDIALRPAQTMIAVTNNEKRIAWITQLGKNFVHVVFPFKRPYPDNLCFQKIAQVPGDIHQFNHHFRMFLKEDLNEEVTGYMKLAYEGERS